MKKKLEPALLKKNHNISILYLYFFESTNQPVSFLTLSEIGS